MHLLDARQATVDDDGEAVDLGQTPGDIIVLSAADSELASLATAAAQRSIATPRLRLANLLRLSHPLSVDLYAEKVVSQAKLVVLRLLGGKSYWSYGLEQTVHACKSRGIPVAVLPGDDQPDLELLACSTLPEEGCHRLWQYMVHGGLVNMANFIAYASSLIGQEETYLEPVALMRAGIYWPGTADLTVDRIRQHWRIERPVAAIVFYRALVQAADLDIIDRTIAALDRAGLNALPLFVTSLKDKAAASLIAQWLDEAAAAVVLNATGFAISAPGGPLPGILEGNGRVVLQMIFSGSSEESWRAGTRGLSARDLAMNVVLPEIDGRIFSRAVAFKRRKRYDPRCEVDVIGFEPVLDRLAFTAELAAAWAKLRNTRDQERRVALIFANYPNRDGRIANGVGLDSPASAHCVLKAMKQAGYRVENLSASGQTLVEKLLLGATNDLANLAQKQAFAILSIDEYRGFYNNLTDDVREVVEARWNTPESYPHLINRAFKLALLPLGNIVVGIQPSRGYDVDPAASYHDPALPPTHSYLAFYFWIRHVFRADAVIHLGKHGNLEWLPGKALALSASCLPEIALGPTPHLYPFIVNDPGEGSQAKRRASAVIIDHLTPPLARAESYGPLAALEALVDEYYQAIGVDARRSAYLRGEILRVSQRLGLDKDLGIEASEPADDQLVQIDNHLCELKELQIRDGLHVLGEAPRGPQADSLLVALVRAPRGQGEGKDASLLRALAKDLGLADFDPLACDMAASWPGGRPEDLAAVTNALWRSQGDTVERLELLALALVGGERNARPKWQQTRAVLETVEQELRPALAASSAAEIKNLLLGLSGRFVPPGPSGAPTRGRLDVLPTGRNFFSIDCRSVPTPAAWHLGWKSAASLVERHLQELGDWPKCVALSAWGTANMRTGGDDVAQALALIGARPVWDPNSGRVTGVEILPASLLDRPRVDVTLRISGFFRDAFPAQIELFDKAVREIATLDEPPELNPLARHVREEQRAMVAKGVDPALAHRRATLRIFGSKPGAYGAGLQALIDEKGWEGDADLARAYVAWGGYAYGHAADGIAEHAQFERRLSAVELVLHNQDNQEHDILDSDDYYQFEGGLTVAVRHLSKRQPAIYHNDHSRVETPRIRTLKEEIGRIVRGRAANPKWLRGVMRHGYKGAFEIAATVDYLFAFAATARVVEDHHFDALYAAYLDDAEVQDFIERNNPAALKEIATRFSEAIERGLWRPARNSVPERLTALSHLRQRAPHPHDRKRPKQ